MKKFFIFLMLITSIAKAQQTSFGQPASVATVQLDWSVSDVNSPKYIRNKPAIFSGAWAELVGIPTLFSGAYADLTGKPNLHAVATSGDYNDLINKPSTSGYTTVQLSGDVTNNNASANTIADVTGLSFAVSSGVTYKFRFVIFYTSAATTTGSRWSINGPATSLLHYRSSYTLTATSRTFNEGQTTYNVPSGASATSVVAGNMAVIEGIITPSANGTVIARFASEISGSAIVAKAKSYVEYQSF
jgi:hypothetical protein